MSIYFLAFLTFWMSTWLVTDIHDWSITDAGQALPVFSALHNHSGTDLHVSEQDPDSHCGVCSYDHGGHMGKTITTLGYIAESIPAQNSISQSLHTDFWSFQHTAPKLRPPIV